MEILKGKEKPENKCAHKACTLPKHARGVCRRHYHALTTFTLSPRKTPREPVLRADESESLNIEDFLAWIRANTGLL